MAETDDWMVQSEIANDVHMRGRVAQCAAKNGCASEAGIDPDLWSAEWSRTWASAPGWWQAWASNLAGGGTDPGANPGVITNGMIDSQVQAMIPFTRVADHAA